MQIDNVEQSTCKSPVFRLYYQENTGANACKCEAGRLFFVPQGPDAVSFYRSRGRGRALSAATSSAARG
jgi:hypothetical protein